MKATRTLPMRLTAIALAVAVAACGDGPTPPSSAGISLSLSQTTLSVQPGDRVEVSVTIDRLSGFAGPVTLSIEGAPAGLTAEFDPSSAPNGTRASTLRLNAAATLAPGTYSITVRGRGQGVPDQTATLTLSVTNPAATTVTFRFCDREVIPIWLAYQSGAGAWTQAPLRADNMYSFPITGRGGVAFVGQDVSRYLLFVIYATASELAELGPVWDFDCRYAAGPNPKQLRGTLAGLGPSDGVDIHLGHRLAIIEAGRASYRLMNVPAGALDLIATRGASGSTNKFIIRRALDLPDGSSIPLLDFNAGEAATPVSARMHVGGLGTDGAFFDISYVTATAEGGFTSAYLEGADTLVTYQGVPTQLLQAGEMHSAFVWALPFDDPNLSTSRVVMSAFRTVEDRALTLGPLLGTPTVTVAASAPYARYRMQLAVQNEYRDRATARFSQGDRFASITTTAAYLGAAPSTWDIVVPDLTAAPGFDVQWALRTGRETRWGANAASGLLDAVREGETVRDADRSGGPAPAALITALRNLGATESLRSPESSVRPGMAVLRRLQQRSRIPR